MKISSVNLMKNSKKNMFSLRPPFRAYNQKELAEKIKEGKFRRIPYRYSEQLNELLKDMLNVKVRFNCLFVHL